jgi:hypothetical protein
MLVVADPRVKYHPRMNTWQCARGDAVAVDVIVSREALESYRAPGAEDLPRRADRRRPLEAGHIQSFIPMSRSDTTNTGV